MRKNKNYFLLLFLIGAFLGMTVSWSVVPRLEALFFSKLAMPVSVSPVSLSKEEVQIFCQKIQRGKGVEVDLGQQKLRLCQDGKKVEEFSVSTGKKESPTPTGKFEVINKMPLLYSNLAQSWMPFWVGFYGDYGFHELPISKGEEKRIGENKLGQPDSIGCVRLGVGNAEKFYHWVEIGTPIIIYGETPAK